MLKQHCVGRALSVASRCSASIFACGLVLTSAGCGGKAASAGSNSTGEGSSTGGTASVSHGPLERQVACELAARLVCERDVTCCSSLGYEVDTERCVALALLKNTVRYLPSSFCETNSVIADITEVGQYYDPIAAGVCLDEMAQSIQDCSMLREDDPAYARVTAACDAVYHGPRSELPGPGDVCFTECSAPAGMVSECIVYFDSSNYCGKAIAASVAGQACGAGCAEGLVCLPGGLCGKRLSDGAACTQWAQCASGTCDLNLDVCASPPRTTDQQCHNLADVSSYQIIFERTAPDEGPLAVTSTHLVWPADAFYDGSLRYAIKDGSARATALTHAWSWADPLIVDNEYLYLQSADQISRVSLANALTEVFYSVFDYAANGWEIEAVRAGSLFLSNRTCTGLARLDLATQEFYAYPQVLPGRTQTAASGVSAYCLYAFDEDSVYAALRTRLSRFDGSGNAIVLTEDALLGDNSGAIQQLVAFEGKIFYLAFPEKAFVFDIATGAVTQLQPALPPTTDGSSTGEVASLALDRARGHLYWVTQNAIQRYDTRLGSFTTIQLGELVGTSLAQLAMDDTYLYWMNRNGIYRRLLGD